MNKDENSAQLLNSVIQSLITILEQLVQQSSENEIVSVFCSFVTYCVRGWLVPIFTPFIQFIMNTLIRYLQQDSQNSLLLKTVTSLTQFYAKSYPEDFYSVLKNVAMIAEMNLTFNSDDYVRELMALFGSFSTVCCYQFNGDVGCIQTVLRICEGYVQSAANRGKVACFAFMNKMLRLEADNENIKLVFVQMAPHLVDVCYVDFSYL